MDGVAQHTDADAGSDRAPRRRLSVSMSNGFFPDGELHRIVEVARIADEVGIDDLSVPDHVVLGTHNEGFFHNPEEPWLEPLTTLGAYASATQRIRLCTGICIAPLRPAALLAKQAATVDVLSQGRLVLGVSTSWSADEYGVLGVDFASRGQRLTDTIGAAQALWRDTPASFESPTVTFEDAYLMPKPVQPDGPPVWFGGRFTSRLVHRVGTLGSGWMPFGHSLDEIAEGRAVLAEAMAAAGRDPAQLEVTGILWPLTADGTLARKGDTIDIARSLEGVAPLAAAGVDVVGFALHYYCSGPNDVAEVLGALAEGFAAYRHASTEELVSALGDGPAHYAQARQGQAAAHRSIIRSRISEGFAES